MNSEYRDGMVNTCFLLPVETSVALRMSAMKNSITLKDLLTTLVVDYLDGEDNDDDAER